MKFQKNNIFYDFFESEASLLCFFSVELSVESYIMEVKILYNILCVEKMMLLNELKVMNKLRDQHIQQKIFCSQIFPKFYTFFFLSNSLIWNLFNFLSYQMHFSIFFSSKLIWLSISLKIKTETVWWNCLSIKRIN